MSEPTRVWPLSLRVLHWISAGLVLGMLGLGVYMVQVVDDTAVRFELTQTHKSVGITILALTIARLGLRIRTVAPAPEPAARALQLTAKAAHVALYVLLLAMPVTGWLMTTTTPLRVPTSVFGLFALPYPLTPDLPTYRLVHAFHVAAAVMLAGLVALHVAAALTHALLWRDRTLVRMWRTPPAAKAAAIPGE
jgi:cytochrome b561